jgi:hypothetical protein
MPSFIAGARFLQEHNWGISMGQKYKEEYDLKPEYARLGEMLGMDMKKSPLRPQAYQRY